MAHDAKMLSLDIADEFILENNIRKQFNKSYQKKLDYFDKNNSD